MTLSAAERISPFPPIQRRKTINAHLSPYERRNPHEPNPSELADHLSGRRSHLVLADTDGTQTGRLAHLRGFRRNRAWLHSSPDADRRHCLHLTHLLLLYGALEDESGPDGLWQRHHLADRLRATARGGGVFYPIVRSLSEAFGSQPGPSSRKIGAYLMQVGYHTDATTCMMFLTSMAGNPLCVGLAASAVGVEITWTNWALAAIVPGLISLALVPWVVSLLSPPEIKAIPNARELAEKELAAMGPMSKDEKVLAFVFVMCLVHADCQSSLVAGHSF